MTKPELFNSGEALAEVWANGNRSTAVDSILGHPAPVAAALAVLVARHLDQLFNEAPIFCSTLADRACGGSQ